jgi:hypothetical protein
MADTGRSGDRAVALLASWFTLIGGTFCCVFILLASSADKRQVLLVLIGAAVAATVLPWLFRDRKRDGGAWLWRRKTRKTRYRLSRKVEVEHPINVVPNRPPTAQELREMKSLNNTWVPRSDASGGRRSDSA